MILQSSLNCLIPSVVQPQNLSAHFHSLVHWPPVCCFFCCVVSCCTFFLEKNSNESIFVHTSHIFFKNKQGKRFIRDGSKFSDQNIVICCFQSFFLSHMLRNNCRTMSSLLDYSTQLKVVIVAVT